MTRLGLASASLSLVVTVLVASLPASSAWAQTEPPRVGTDAPTAAAAPTPPAPAAADPAPAAPAAPPAAAAPSPLLAAPAPVPASEPGTLPPLPPEERPPIYKQTWFWAVVAVVGLTAVMIAYGLGTQGPATPNTDFGNMRAF